jgi:hypothetical protein
VNASTSPRKRRSPTVEFDGSVFRVAHRGRSLELSVMSEDDGLVVELDGVTHWAPAAGQAEGDEISIEDLGAVLDAVEEAAVTAGFSISFE